MSSEREQNTMIDTHYTTVHTVGREHGKRAKMPRYMQKDGRCPVVFQQSPGEWTTYLTDIFTTLVEIRWRVMLLIFSLSYILSWLFFGLVYWLIAYVHKDIENPENSPCVDNVRSFTAAFLFSMETQATIGYGFRGMTENCIVAIIVVVIQDVLSCIIDTIVIGIAVAKMASARKRAQTVGFSRCAVVNQRDGALCLSWRLGDFRGNHILEGTAMAQVVRHVKHPSGMISMSYQNLDIEGRDIILATPVTIIHKLESGSPLYSLGPEGLREEEFELVVSFTYTADTTGILHQTRTSYTLADIRWGQRFQDMIRVGKSCYKVDYSLFHETTWVQVPMVSAEECDRMEPPAEVGQSQHPVLRSIRKPSRNGLTKADVNEELLQEAWL